MSLAIPLAELPGLPELMDRAAAVRLDEIPAGSGASLVSCELTGVTRVLEPDDACLLRACRSFLPLHVHAAQLIATVELDEDEESALPALLRDACDQGLLISAAHLIGALTAAAGAYAPPPPISTLAILTCGRPPVLERAVSSYGHNLRRFGRTCEIAVMDDTRDAGRRETNRALLRELARDEGLRIRYAGLEEKRRFAAALSAESQVADEIIDFALFGMEGFESTCGANRNAVLLDTVGEVLLSVDDDTLCEIAEPPALRRALSLDSSGIAVWDHWFYASREELSRDLTLRDVDVLSIHEQALGKRLDAYLAEHGGRAEWKSMSASLLGNTAVHADGRVLLTMNGLFGDGGYGAPLLSYNGPSFERLIASEQAYRIAMSSPEMIRAVPGPTLTMAVPVAGGFLGLDHRELLPPFMPVARGEDTIFGALLNRAFPGCMQALLPWLLHHSPPHARRHDEKALLLDAIAPRTPRLLLSALNHLPMPRARGGPTRLKATGAALVEYGSLPLRDFCSELRMSVLRSWGPICERYDRMLTARERRPTYWAEDLERLVRTVEAHVPQQDYIVPSELRKGRSVEDAMRIFQRALVGLGRLLGAWPSLVEAARALRARGERLAPILCNTPS